MSNNNSYSYGRFKKTLLAASIMAIGSAAYAAEPSTEKEINEDKDIEEVIVTSTRRNLETAQELKRSSNTVIDSITAEDLGDFPDKSIAEALQRVPGVTVTRFADSDRLWEFTAEPSGVLVRGLPYVRSEFNGRDSFSATSSRGLSWGDVSPELMAGVDVYKAQSAELTEGGISGLVNLRTRLPFDRDGQSVAFSMGTNYNATTGDTSPEFSGIFSDRWETAAGEFGVMVNLAHSDVVGSSQSQGRWGYKRYDGVYPDANGSLEGDRWIPGGVSLNEYEYERTRDGGALALQWQDDEGKYLASLQYNRSNYKSSSISRSISIDAGLGSNNRADGSSPRPDEYVNTPNQVARPAPGTGDFVFDESGNFMSGVITRPRDFFGLDMPDWGSETILQNGAGEGMVLTDGCGWGGCPADMAYLGNYVATGGGFGGNEEMIQDLSFNFKWKISDRILANFDVQYVDATLDSFNMGADIRTFANTEIDLSGEQFKIVLHNPTNVNPTGADTDVGLFGTLGNYHLTTVNADRSNNEGNELAAKADFVFEVDSGFVESVKTGIRYASREQQVNAGGNWRGVLHYEWSPGWSRNTGPHSSLASPASGDFTGYPVDDFTVDTWSNEWGQIYTADGINKLVFPDGNAMRANDWENTISAEALGTAFSGYVPVCERDGLTEGSCYRPVEQLEISEETGAAFVQVNFGGDDLQLFGRPLSGNVGVRYVQTDVESVGGEQYPRLEECKDNPLPEEGQEAPALPQSITCYVADEDKLFIDDGAVLGTSTVTHHNVLPSLNIKYEITDKLQSRLALSRAMSRPDIGMLRNYIGVSSEYADSSDLTDPLWYFDSEGERRTRVRYKASAQNPFLKPMLADQVDMTLEYYPSRSNSASIAVFAKEFKDYIQGERYTRSMTHNGVTRDVEVSGPVNGDGASMYGVEIQGTHFMDYLPDPFKGFGVQANYTHIENSGITSSGISSAEATGNVFGGATIEVDTLENLPSDAYNFSLFYDKNKFSARLAYNWRSETLISANSYGSSFPTWSDAYAQLDASASYNFSDNYFINVGVSNLTDEQFVTTQQIQDVSDGGNRLPSNVSKSERRYTLSLRANF